MNTDKLIDAPELSRFAIGMRGRRFGGWSRVGQALFKKNRSDILFAFVGERPDESEKH